MNTKRLTRTLTSALLLTGLGATVGVQAQYANQDPRARFQRRQFNNQAANQQNINQNAVNGMQMMEKIRQLRDFDPSRSAIGILLKRGDVRTELSIDARQREAMEALQKKGPQDMAQRLMNTESFKQLQDQAKQMRNLPAADRQKMREQMRADMQKKGEQILGDVQNMQSDIDTQMEQLLRPAQDKRLKQLDLQWRGPLALSDPKVAEPFELSQEQSQQIATLLQEYRKAQSEAMAGAMGLNIPRPQQDNGSSNAAVETNPDSPEKEAGTQPRRRPTDADQKKTLDNANRAANRIQQGVSQQEMQNRMDEAQKQLDAARKTFGDRVLRLLSPEQANYWRQQNGQKFTFRIVD